MKLFNVLVLFCGLLGINQAVNFKPVSEDGSLAVGSPVKVTVYLFNFLLVSFLCLFFK
jgi:hypothetical protein